MLGVSYLKYQNPDLSSDPEERACSDEISSV
jgi:hypothetical protein